jgi:small GTP-binding protein
MIESFLRRTGILSDKEAELRALEKELLNRLGTALARFGQDVSAEDLKRFHEAQQQIEAFFLLVIAGEFNSGKSTFINALLGDRVLPEGVTPTTDRIHLLRFGEQPSEDLLEPYLLERTHPSSLLREMHIVDTPGTNAIIRRHEELTREFIPRCDLVLFVTSADRPFTESERQFLEHIRQWGKKIVFVINKIDILRNDQEVKEIVTYVRSNAESMLGTKVEIFPVSSRQAINLKTGEDSGLLTQSGFAGIEKYLLHTLDEKERVKLKLLNPLNVGLRLAAIYKEEAFKRLKLLTVDIAAIENIDQQLALFHRQMLEDFQPRLASVEGLLKNMELRGMEFFDQTVQLRQIRNLLRKEKVRSDFERIVIADTPQRIEEEIGRLIDWLVERYLKLWQDIDRYIDRKEIARHRDQLIGETGQGFHYNRQALLDSVGRLSREVVSSYNKEAEAKNLATEVRDTFATTAIAEVGAVGLGAFLVIVAHGALADFTGILAAGAVAIGGLYVIPRKREQVKKDFKRKVEELRRQLNDALSRQVNNEIRDSSERINETIGPYRRFVRLQQEQLSEAQAELVTVENALVRLKADVERQ